MLGTGSFDDGSGEDFVLDGRIVSTVILDERRMMSWMGEPLVGREKYEMDGR